VDRDNPFEPSPSLVGSEPNEGDTLQPVEVEWRAILQRCWELFQRNPGIVLGAVLIPLVIGILIALVQQLGGLATGLLQGWAADSNNDGVMLAVGVAAALFQFALAFVSWAINVYLQLGTVRIFTRLARGLPAELTLLFGELVRVPSAMIASLLIVLAVGLGLLLLVVPGIIVALGLQLALYALVDQDLGPIESLRESWRLTDGYKVELLIVGIVMTVLAVAVTCLTCCIGYLAVIPIFSLAQSVIYHSLLHQRGPRLEGT
jgi:hypothetical protein